VVVVDTVLEGTVLEGTVLEGTVLEGTVLEGTVLVVVEAPGGSGTQPSPTKAMNAATTASAWPDRLS